LLSQFDNFLPAHFSPFLFGKGEHDPASCGDKVRMA
jgi:hypothetical protein